MITDPQPYHPDEDEFFLTLVLSLDVTQYFVDELGMGGFYSSRVRELAREIIAPAVGEDFYDFVGNMASVLPNALFSAMEERCTPVEYSAFLQWCNSRPTQSEEARILDWQAIVPRVCYLWQHQPEARHPLAGPENAHIRIVLCAYSHRLKYVHLEIGRMCENFLSEWDKWLAGKAEVETWESTLSSYVSDVCGREFWTELTKLADEQVIEELLKWGAKEGIINGNP